MTRQRTLLAHRLYYGVDAQRLREGSGRVLSRVVGLAPDRACVSAHHVLQDYGMDEVQGQALIGAFVAEGLLRPRAGRPGDFVPTERLAEMATARVVDPLPRTRARLIVGKAGEVAARINADSTRNPLAIEAVAVFGSYMSLDDELADLELAVVVRARSSPALRLRWRRWRRQPPTAPAKSGTRCAR